MNANGSGGSGGCLKDTNVCQEDKLSIKDNLFYNLPSNYEIHLHYGYALWGAG